MHDARNRIKEISNRFGEIKKGLNIPQLKLDLKELEAKATDPDFWKEEATARGVMQKLGGIKKELDITEKLEKDVSDLTEFSKELDVDSDNDLFREIKRVEKELEQLELSTYLKGEYDMKTAILSIHAGQGGTEAMDWAHMLLRMYLRFCERWDFKVEVIDKTSGEEAGIKSATLRISGHYAYGHLKREAGSHRLVRQSPFNADKLRQTSFALVEVLPEFAEVELPDLELNDEDLEWQFFRASSQGGQNVQKVSTAVRLIHKPTKITVTAQAERFQEQNRRIALDLLRSKLWHKKQQELEHEKQGIKGDYKPASWGTQIRSYVLHPYKMVKDLRTKVETSDTDGVLSGDLDKFIEAELRLN